MCKASVSHTVVAVWLGQLSMLSAQPLIIDHLAVNKYSQIPDQYLAAVRHLWLNVPGESHSSGYRIGCVLLEALDSRFAARVQSSGIPEGYNDAYLRVNPATWTGFGWSYYGYGEQDWYTSEYAIQKTLAHLAKANTNSLGIAAMGFGWCWDATWHNPPGGEVDPVYQVRWAGSSEGGPDGDLRWGLDAEDTVLTDNRVCMDSYLSATQQYDDFCRTSGFGTRVFFTTGPVDSYSGESGYQRQLKYDHIREYISRSTNAILLDYADILSWSGSGQQNSETWVDFGGATQSFQMIHPDNMVDLNGSYVEDGDHIGERGAVRLAKALWVMLARMAGWNPDTVLDPPVIGFVHAFAGDIQFHFSAASNTLYDVEFASDLSTDSWQSLTNIASQPFDREILIAEPATNSQRFYRVTAQRSP